MAASPEPEQPPADAAPPGKLASKLTLVLAVVGGIAAGAAAGAFAVGPLVAQKLAPQAAVADAAHGAEDDEGEDGAAEGKEGETAAKPVHTLDNLVLNPAESGGQRFLLLTIAFELKDAATLDAMKARDAELRDAVLQTVGGKSVEFLADMARRDSLKSELKTVTGQLFPDRKHVVRRIYFPQFVIQ